MALLPLWPSPFLGKGNPCLLRWKVARGRRIARSRCFFGAVPPLRRPKGEEGRDCCLAEGWGPIIPARPSPSSSSRFSTGGEGIKEETFQDGSCAALRRERLLLSPPYVTLKRLSISFARSLTFGKSSSASSKVEEDKSTGGLSIVSRRRPPGGGTRRLESLFLPPSIPAFPAPAAPLFRRLLDPASNPVLFYPLTALRIA